MDFQFETSRVACFGSVPKPISSVNMIPEFPMCESLSAPNMRHIERRASDMSLSATCSNDEDSLDIAIEAQEGFNPDIRSTSSSPMGGQDFSSPYSSSPPSSAQGSLSHTPLPCSSLTPPTFTLSPDDVVREDWTFGRRPSAGGTPFLEDCCSSHVTMSSADVLKLADATRELRDRLILEEKGLRQKYIDMEFFRWRTKFEDTTATLGVERLRTSELEQRLGYVTDALKKEQMRANDLETRLYTTTEALEEERARTYGLMGELNELRSRMKCEAAAKWEFLKVIFKDI